MENFCTTFRLLSCLTLILVLCERSSGVTLEEDITLTLPQKKALDLFKDIMLDQLPIDKPYMKKDLYLLKWLRSRNFNVKRAEEFLLNDLKWREENRMYTIHEEDWKKFQKQYKVYMDGRDRDGKLILYFDVGGMNLRRTVMQGEGDQLLRYADKVLDEACGEVIRMSATKNVTRGHLIVDAKDFSIVEHGCLRCVPLLLRIIVTYENHYPLCADKIIFLNLPSIADPIVNLARPVLSRDTNRALRIYGNNRQIWEKALNEFVDKDQLPPQVGGTKIYKGMENEDDENDYY